MYLGITLLISLLSAHELHQLGEELNEGLGSHVEEFARELDDSHTSSTTADHEEEEEEDGEEEEQEDEGEEADAQGTGGDGTEDSNKAGNKPTFIQDKR